MVKQQKHVKIFTGSFQFNFRAAKKKPLFCHPALGTITKSRGDTYDKTRFGTAYIGKKYHSVERCIFAEHDSSNELTDF